MAHLQYVQNFKTHPAFYLSFVQWTTSLEIASIGFLQVKYLSFPVSALKDSAALCVYKWKNNY